MPALNRRHLMLAPSVVRAVAEGRFHIQAVDHVSEGIELLTGMPVGELNASGHYPHDSVLGHAQDTLLAYRRAVLQQEHPKAARRHFRAADPPKRR